MDQSVGAGVSAGANGDCEAARLNSVPILLVELTVLVGLTAI